MFRSIIPAALVSAALALAGCSSSPSTSSSTSSSPASTSTAATSNTPSTTIFNPDGPPPGVVEADDGSGPMTPGADQPPSDAPVASAPPEQPAVGVVALPGGDQLLDASITGPMSAIGVQLLPPADVISMFGVPQFPAPAGENTVVLEADIKASKSAEGVTRSDRVAYMLEADVNLAASLDAVAAELAIDNRYSVTVERTEDGNGAGSPVCEERTASPISDAYLPLWTFGGCGDYADSDYAGLLALEVKRDTTFAGDLTVPPVLESSVADAQPVTAATAGTIAGWSLTFGKPQGGDGGSTLSIELRVAPADPTGPVEQTVSAALPDWAHAGSALWSNAAQSWTATGDLLVYRSSTRLGGDE